MVILHAGAPPAASLALLVLIALAIFVTAAVVSDLQRDDAPAATKRRARSPRTRPDS